MPVHEWVNVLIEEMEQEEERGETEEQQNNQPKLTHTHQFARSLKIG